MLTNQQTNLDYDVVVIGAGIGGLAASIFLGQANFRVACIEPKPFPHTYVGESLDFSTPGLVRQLGLSWADLEAENIATCKEFAYLYSFGEFIVRKRLLPWVAGWPLYIERLTYHINRTQFDQKLLEKAQALGVDFIWDKVTNLSYHNNQILTCHTKSGLPIKAAWFIDASGRGHVFNKHLQINRINYSQQKVCIWSYFESEFELEATRLYPNLQSPYLDWVWEIPITPHKISVGYIISAEELQQQRRCGKSVRQIFAEILTAHKRFIPLLNEQKNYKIHTCTYQTGINQKMCGPNWFCIGEAAVMHDPLTAYGVTAALRHAQSAATLIKKRAKNGKISTSDQYLYTKNIRQIGSMLNYNIETAFYEWPLRQAFGPSNTFKIYALSSLVPNIIYSKFHPKRWVGLTLYGGLLGLSKAMVLFFWCWAHLILFKRRFVSPSQVTPANNQSEQNPIPSLNTKQSEGR